MRELLIAEMTLRDVEHLFPSQDEAAFARAVGNLIAQRHAAPDR